MDSANNNTATATGKRKAGDFNPTEGVNNGANTFVRGSLQPPYAPQQAAVAASSSPKKGVAGKKKSKPTDSAKAQARLEANRKAARESRRRKKVLVEELQRSVIFFSRANGQLKQKNEELERMFIQAQAQAQIAARNGTTAAAASAEGGEEVQEGYQGGELKTEDGGAVKPTADEVSDTADVKEEGNSVDVSQDDTLLATAGGDQEQATTDTQPQQQQQQEMTNIPFPGMVQQPIPFSAVTGGAAAPAMDPNTMMYMMMMSGNPLANTMMAANPMMALQMFNQLNAATAGAMAGGVVPNQQQQPQVPNTTQGTNAAATTAAAPTAFPAMPVGLGNVIMPTPGGAFNPFGGFPAAAAGTTNQEAATTATAAEGDSPSAAADVTEETNV